VVLCYGEEITSLLTKWLQNLESLAAYLLTGSAPSPAHSTQASTDITTAAVVGNDTATCTNQQETQTRGTFEEISKAFYGQTYQNLSDVVKKAVTELATLCAEMEVYASQSHSSSGAAGRDKERETTMDDAEREIDSRREKESDRTTVSTNTENERDKAIDSSSSSSCINRCSSLVDFIRCYGPLLDSVRLKQQLLCSREWGERRECLTALSHAKETETCTAGKLATVKLHFMRNIMQIKRWLHKFVFHNFLSCHTLQCT
jgi:hypothetical protein